MDHYRISFSLALSLFLCSHSESLCQYKSVPRFSSIKSNASFEINHLLLLFILTNSFDHLFSHFHLLILTQPFNSSKRKIHKASIFTPLKRIPNILQMKHKHKLILIIALTSSLTLLTILLLAIIFCRRKSSREIESGFESREVYGTEDLIKFNGGEGLTVEEILDAPGEVIGKSSYGTLYRASLVNSDSVALLRFLRPTCTLRIKEAVPFVELLGSIRHPNLVPLYAFYRGPRGEKLMVHPFYGHGNLAQFIKDGDSTAPKWPIIHKISIGIARGVHHLHSAMQKPMVHGNLKSKNILLDHHHNPYVSDFGLHLLLSPTAAQQMLEASDSQGYKAPELLKFKEATIESDIYSLGIILLELLTGKFPIDHDLYLSNVLSGAILDDKIMELYHPVIHVGLSNEERVVSEERILMFFQLGMACCSPSPHLRPNIEQIVEKLQKIGR